MSLTEDEVHFELVKACQCGDINQLYQLSYFNKTHVDKLIQGDVLHIHKTKYGAYKPGDYLYIASEKGHYDIIESLVKLGSSIDRAHSNGKTPVLVACENGNLQVVKCLRNHGAVLHDDTADFKDAQIYRACQYGHLNIVQYIVDEHSTILLKKVNGAIGQTPDMEYIHIWSGLAKISKTDNSFFIGNFILFIACMKGHLHIAKYLIDKGVSVNHLSDVSGFYSASTTPLSVACRRNDYELAIHLIQQKAEITESIVDQYTEFMCNILASKLKDFRRSASISSVKDCEKTTQKRKSIYWESLNLYKIHRFWLEQFNESICLMDIHLNHLTELPVDFFVLLPNLVDLDVSCNQLKQLPSEGLAEAKLKRLMVCKNKLSKLPFELFRNKLIEKIDVSQNRLQTLPCEIIHEDGSIILWDCPSLKHLKCSFNVLGTLPRAIEGATGLEKLICNNNMISVFDVTWRCPLNELDLSFNQLAEFTCMSQMVWSKTLQRLNLTHNSIQSISSNICHLNNIQVLDISYNEIQTLPPPNVWRCKMLSKLNLAHNKITANTGTSDFIGVDKKKLQDAIATDAHPLYLTTCEFPIPLFSDTLQFLDLSFNCLENIPESLCHLIALTELDLGNNPSLRMLPPELGNLKNIWNLKLANLVIPEVPFKLDDRNQGKTVLPYLRQKLRKSVPFNRMKLMVVGLQGRGKTTLIATLQDKRPPPDQSTVGIVVEEWSLTPSTTKSFTSMLNWSSHLDEKDGIIFSCWDLAGQHVYYSTHQCFLTRKTLYLVVFNTTHGKEGVESLGPWLLNIQARAPNSKVIVVGTHIDRLPSSNKKAVLLRMEKEVMQKYDKKGFPLLSGCIFVSNITGEGLQKLREKIYETAHAMNERDSKLGIHFGKQAPMSYIQLYDSIIKQSVERKKKNEPPILTTYELLALAANNDDNDIYDVDELIHAASFLHENGILLHFNDQLRELNTLFFIDPPWLCDMLSLVVAVREINPFVVNGYIKREELMLLLKNPRLPEKFIPQYLQLLERFEIVLTLDGSKLLIPSMLPAERPEDLLDKVQQKCPGVFRSDAKLANEFLTRNYHMNYIPSGFWSRLIARLSIAVHKWGIVVSLDNTDDNLVNNEEMQYSLVLWRDGILVMYDDGYFLVESFQDDMKYEEYSNRGVSITVWSKYSDFSVMGFIVDHLDTLITEWYPGLEDVDEFGVSLILKYIPCPTCIRKYQESDNIEPIMLSSIKGNYGPYFRNPNHINQFDIQICALAAINYRAISCKRHEDEAVPLQLVVPELLLTDLPACFVIENDQFEFHPSEETRLGEGGAGGVYRGIYKQENVAVKQFHSSTKTHVFKNFATDELKYSDDDKDLKMVFVPVEQTILEQIEDGKVMRAFWELRQEVAVLCRLQHPNIVTFIGVCLTPLCFALELAPLGSLQSILEELKDEREEKCKSQQPSNNLHLPAILGKAITCKIALQVGRAIAYLHESEIIYRDLKSDNILVFSLDENDIINVKISDYGISTFATPQGVLGEGGTPGFQAPEVKVSCAYNEKVDIFSYGIWLYELISGYRPFREYRTATEMKRAVNRGIRPSLAKDNINPNLPTLETLMEDCWETNPILRPTSNQICTLLESVDTYIIESIHPKLKRLENVTCVYPWLDTDIQERLPTMVCWCGHGENRRYELVDVMTSAVLHDIHCSGPRVLCALQVNNSLWLGTEGRQLEVFAKVLSPIPTVMYNIELKDHVMSLLLYHLKESGIERIFASLANGTLMVLTKCSSQGRYQHSEPLFNEEPQDIIAYEKDQWSNMMEINLASQGLPAKCMCLTKNSTELWVGSGNMIVILNPESLTIIDRIQALKTTRSLISSLVTNNKYIWSADWKNANIVQWCVATRQKLYTFKCNIENPLGKNLILINDSSSILNVSVEDFTDGPQNAYSQARNRETTDQILSNVESTNMNIFKLDDNNGNNDNATKVSNDQTGIVENDVQKMDNMKIENEDHFAGNNNETLKLPYVDSLNNLDIGLQKSSPSVNRRTTEDIANLKSRRSKSNTMPSVKPRSLSEDSPLDKNKNSIMSGKYDKGNDNDMSYREEESEYDIIKESDLMKKVTSVRRQPSLMMFSRNSKKSLRSSQKKMNKPTVVTSNSNDNTLKFPRSNSIDNTSKRPRSYVISSSNLERVTSMFYFEDMLWIGRSSGDVLVVDVHEDEAVNQNEVNGAIAKNKSTDDEQLHKRSMGNVIDILCKNIKGQMNCMKTITNIIPVPSSRHMLFTLRMEPRSERLHSISTRLTRVNSYIDDHFQLILVNSWSRDEFDKFQLDITSSHDKLQKESDLS